MQKPKLPSSSKLIPMLSQPTLAVALKFSVVGVVVALIYFQDLSLVFTGALTNESTYHILAIPFLFIYLVYRKRKMVGATVQIPQTGTHFVQKYFSAISGLLLFTVAILTYWYGSYTFTPLEYHLLTLPFLTAGLVLILFNTQTLRQLLFPIAFLAFLTPPPDEILYGLGSSLANLSAYASNSFANVLGLHAVLTSSNAGPVITLIKSGTQNLSFNIDVACSGIYSIIGFVIFAVFIAYLTRGRLGNKLAVLIMGIPLILALNVIRITTILGIGNSFGEDLALQFFHAIGATVLMFVGTLLLLVITDRVFKKPKLIKPCTTCNPHKDTARSYCPSCGKLLKNPKLRLNRLDAEKIAGVAVIAILLLSIQVPVFALTQGPAQVMVQTPSGTRVEASNSTSILPSISGYTLNYEYRDIQFEAESGDDAALVYLYSANNGTSDVWVSIQIAPSTTSEHRWETCLINAPLSQGGIAEVNQLDLRDVFIQSNPPITARYFAFEYKKTNETEVVLYWYETATFNTNSTSQTKSVMLSLILYPNPSLNVSACEKLELPMALAVNNFWQPIQTWSPVALTLSENGMALAIGTSIALVILVIYLVSFNRQTAKRLLTLYGKLSNENKNVVKAVENAQKQGVPTTEGILAELEKLTGSKVDEEWLNQKLSEVEKTDLIGKTVASRIDEPVIHWRSQEQLSLHL